MKKITLTLAAIAAAFTMNAQVLDEDFQSGTFPPTNWQIINNHPSPDSNWNSSPDVNDPSDLAANIAYTDNQLMDEWLITPSLDLSSTTGYELTFRTFMSFNWMVTEAGADLMVKVSTDGGTTWTQEWFEEDYGTFENFEYFNVTIPLGNYDGESDVKIAFHYLGDDGAQVRIDDVVVDSALKVDDQNFDGFNHYVANNVLTLKANTTISNARLYNILGQQVISKKLGSQSADINLNSLNSGVYLVQVEIEGQSKSFKIVKK